jgi:hypothetical protein
VQSKIESTVDSRKLVWFVFLKVILRMKQNFSHPSGMARLLVAIGFLLLAAFYATLVWSDQLTELGGDSAAYLLISRYYSPYHAVSAAVVNFKLGMIAPPLFPWFLSIVDGGYNLFAAHLVVAFFATASVAALYFWLRQEALPIGICAFIALIFGVMPSTWFQIFNIWTEFPYLFFSLASVAVVARLNTVDSPRTWYGAAILVACATLIRVASLPLLAAFILFLLYKRPQRFILIGLVATVPFMIWLAYSAHTEIGAISYVDQFSAAYSGNPVERFLQQLQRESKAIVAAWQFGLIGPTFSSVLPKRASGLGLICICGWLYRLKSLRFDAIYVALYSVMLLLWPHPEEVTRYSFVIFPFLIADGFLLVYIVASRLFGGQRQMLLVGLFGGVWGILMLPTLLFDIGRFFEEAPSQLAFAKHRIEWYSGSREAAINSADFQQRFFRDLREADRIVSANDCIFSIKPPIVTLITDRISLPPPKTNVDEKQFDAGIQKCRYAYVLAFVSPSYGESLYPLGRLGGRAKTLTGLSTGNGEMEGGLIEIAR